MKQLKHRKADSLTILITFCCAATSWASDVRLAWGDLAPGPNMVGYRSSLAVDHDRKYNITFDDQTEYSPNGGPRPVVFNVWYPAAEAARKAKAMTQRDYLTVSTADPHLAKFAAKLSEYERAVVTEELAGKPEADLTPADRKLLSQFLDAPTASIRNALPQSKKFPVVIYHPGFGSSFEDNSVMCEYLASRGYVVVTSAFQEASGKSFNTDAQETSDRDTNFLIEQVKRLPYGDATRVGMMGHSGGGQAALFSSAQKGSQLSAVVSLDNTEDYYSRDNSQQWTEMVTAMKQAVDRVKIPYLVAARSSAIFDLMSSVKGSDRYLMTLGEIGHSDFISQGVIRRELEHHRNPSDHVIKEERDQVRNLYRAECEFVADFFDVHLKNEPEKKDRLKNQYGHTSLESAAHVEFLAAGTENPVPFPEDSKIAPTPRQIRPYLSQHGLESTIKLLKRFYARQPNAAIFQGEFGFSLIYELLDHGQITEARALAQLFQSFGQNIVKVLLNTGDALLASGHKSVAIHYYEKALRLDPTSAVAKQKIKKAKSSEAEVENPSQTLSPRDQSAAESRPAAHR